jgi:DNA-binding CsgD family transcriptional regulator
MTLEVEGELADRLRLLARARGEPLESLTADLLHRGLTQVMRRQQAEEALAGLTPRQGEVARLAAAGRTNRQIARELWLSPETVKTHLRRALEHFDLHSKAELRLLLFELDGGPLRGAQRDPLRDALPGCADATKREAHGPRG